MVPGLPSCSQVLSGGSWCSLVPPGVPWCYLAPLVLLVVPLYSFMLLGALLVATSCDSTYPTALAKVPWCYLTPLVLLVVPWYSLVLLGALLVATSCDSTYPTGWLQHSLGKWMCLVR